MVYILLIKRLLIQRKEQELVLKNYTSQLLENLRNENYIHLL